MEDILKNLALLVSLTSVLIMLVRFFSNQLFNAEIEKHLYSNLEKFVSHAFSIAVIAVFIFMLIVASMPTPEEKNTKAGVENLNNPLIVILCIIALVFLAILPYMMGLLSNKLFGKLDYYFEKDDITYTIIKKHKKNVILCSHKEKIEDDKEIIVWKFFYEEEIFNTTTIKRVPFEDAKNKISLDMYNRIRSMKLYTKVFLAASTILVLLLSVAGAIEKPLKGFTYFFSMIYFGIIASMYTGIVVTILRRFRAGKELSKNADSDTSRKEAEPSV
ncbi:hypothetical protein [Listeria booriae]|nr:hypothetical protein [Listeria booriae]